MSRGENKKIGKIGEDLAAEYLRKKGYQIIERNWGSKWGEIDIICRYKNIYIFTEVKTKIGEEFGTPEEMISKGKLHQVQRMAEAYIADKDDPCQARIDVVAVVLNRDLSVKRLNHYEAVY